MGQRSIAEDLVMALGTALVRKGVLTEIDIHDAASDSERLGDDEVAHALRCIIIEAAGEGEQG